RLHSICIPTRSMGTRCFGIAPEITVCFTSRSDARHQPRNFSVFYFSFPRSAWECLLNIPATAQHMHSHAENGNEAARHRSRNYCVFHFSCVGMPAEHPGDCAAYAFPRGAWERGALASL